MSSPPLQVDDLSFSDLDLITSPPAAVATSSSKQTAAKAATRPSFKPAAAPRQSVAAASQANLRLLQGVNKPPPMASSNRAAGAGGNKRRTSLFVPSALPKATASVEEGDDSVAAEQAEGDDSLIEAMKNSKPREAALPTLPASFHQRPAAKSAGTEEADAGVEQTDSETKEQVQRQLDDLAKMNSSFEAYERMLQGTVGQIDLFSNRLEATSTLLSSYIDLLRRSSSHQSLLLNPSWQGQTIDKLQHAEAMRDLEEEMERRRRQREEEEERLEQERLRVEQQREEEEYRRSISGTSARGGVRGRGAGTAVRGRPTTTGVGGRGGATPTASRGRGAVPSAMRGRGSIAGRPSGIPAPSSTRGSSTAVRGSVRGRGTVAK